jgi:hypothetical protein
MALVTRGDGITLKDNGTAWIDIHQASASYLFSGATNGYPFVFKGPPAAGGTKRSVFEGDPDGSANLYFAGVKNLATQANGVDIYSSGGRKMICAYLSNIFLLYNNTTGGVIQFLGDDSEDAQKTMILANPNTSVDLHYDGVKKFETTETGAKVTGTLEADSIDLGDGEGIAFGAGPDAIVGSDGSTFKIWNGAGAEVMATFNNGSGVELFHNNVKKFETLASGAQLAGTMIADGYESTIANTWSKQQNSAVATLSSSSNAVAWNLTTGQSAKHTMTEDTTISAPSNMVNGGTYILRIIQAAGDYTLSWNAAFDWGEVSAPEEPSGNGGYIVVTFTSNGSAMIGVEFTREDV